MPFIIFFSLVFLVIIIFVSASNWAKREESKGWRKDDVVFLKPYSFTGQNNDEYYKLLGWTNDYIFIEDKVNKTTQKVGRENLKINHTAIWRKNEEDCRRYMKEDPGFTTESNKKIREE